MRNRQKRMSNVAESGEEHSIIWGMFMVATLNAATMGKNFSTIQNFVKHSEDLTLKQMFVPGKTTEIMMLSMEGRLNSSGTFSQDSQRCSSVMKSMIY